MRSRIAVQACPLALIMRVSPGSEAEFKDPYCYILLVLKALVAGFARTA